MTVACCEFRVAGFALVPGLSFQDCTTIIFYEDLRSVVSALQADDDFGFYPGALLRVILLKAFSLLLYFFTGEKFDYKGDLSGYFMSLKGSNSLTAGIARGNYEQQITSL